MKLLFSWLIVISTNLLPLWGTSVSLVVDECPICKQKSHHTVLKSYSMFGEPSRDFMDSPVFAFSGPKICPWDLYVSQSGDWKIEDQNKIARIREQLKGENPVIRLTSEEGKFIEVIRNFEDQSAFVALRKLWWFRTMQSPLNTQNEILVTMKLFRASYREQPPFPELREVYRERLLELFQRGAAEKSESEKARLRYQYLHAEFLRKGNQFDRALEEFSELNQRLSAMPSEERLEHEPLVTWTKEQALRLRLKKVDTKILIQSVIAPLPNPWRDNLEFHKKGASEAAKNSWLRHRWALEELVQRCAREDQEGSKHLWDLLQRDAQKLLAIAETISCPPLNSFSKTDLRWATWSKELADQLKRGKIPKGVRTKINQVRNINILRRLVSDGRPEYLRKAGEEADTPEGRLRAALTIIDHGKSEESVEATKAALKELRTLDWKEANKEDMFDYPLQYLSKTFALSGERFRIEFEESLTKPWKDPFFKEMTRLWLGKSNALAMLKQTEALKTKPKYPGYGPAQMVYFYLQMRKDPVWKDRCLDDLKKLNMLNDRVQNYAGSILDPVLAQALRERHTHLNDLLKKKDHPNQDWDWESGEASEIEDLWRNSKLMKMPLEISK